MAAKKTKLAMIEDMENASFALHCKKGHQFSKTGGWLSRNLVFGCPVCGDTIAHMEKDVNNLFQDRISVLRSLAREGKISIVQS